MIRFTPNFTNEQIKEMLQQRKETIIEAIISRFRFIGEQFINNARNYGSYTDRTGNLRSANGYAIIRNGVQLYSGFSDKGEIIGLEVCKEQMERLAAMLIEQYPTHIILICLNGMNYAVYVESKGFDVITSSAFTASNEIKEAMQEIAKKANSKNP